MHTVKTNHAFFILQSTIFDTFSLDTDYLEIENVVREASENEVYVDIYTASCYESKKPEFTLLCKKDAPAKDLVMQMENRTRGLNNAMCDDVNKMRIIYDYINKYPEAAKRLVTNIIAHNISQHSYLSAYMEVNKDFLDFIKRIKQGNYGKKKTPVDENAVYEIATNIIKTEQFMENFIPEFYMFKDVDHEAIKRTAIEMLDKESYIKKCPVCKDESHFIKNGNFVSLNGDVYCLRCKSVVRKNSTRANYFALFKEDVINYFELIERVGMV